VSEYAQTVLGHSTEQLIKNGSVPQLDLELEKKVQAITLKLIEESLINSAHDCSDGGLAVCVAESCFSSLGREATGVRIDLTSNGLSPEAILFAESPSRIVISFAPENLDQVSTTAGDCPFEIIGEVTSDRVEFNINGNSSVNVATAELEAAWETTLETHLDTARIIDN
jgi:phosphoribosylformylglycinamidine synthase